MSPLVFTFQLRRLDVAVLFDNAVTDYQLIAIPVSNSRPNPYALFFTCPSVDLTNIKLWGVARFYRLRTTPIGVRACAFSTLQLRAPDERFFNLELPATGIQDGVQFIPLYEFSRVIIFDNAP